MADSEKFTCKKGWIMTQCPEDKSMVPFFVKTRSTEIVDYREERAGWTNKLINDGKSLEGKYVLEMGNHYMESFSDNGPNVYSKTLDVYNAVVFFPYNMKLNKNLSININLNATHPALKKISFPSFEFIFDDDEENISGIVISFKLSENVTIDKSNNPFKYNSKDLQNRILINLEGDIAGHLTRIFDTRCQTYNSEYDYHILKLSSMCKNEISSEIYNNKKMMFGILVPKDSSKFATTSFSEYSDYNGGNAGNIQIGEGIDSDIVIRQS